MTIAPVPAAKRTANRALTVLHRIEDIFLAVLLTATMGVAFVQIVLRNLMGASLVWGDVLVRILVLWIGLAGAMLATRQNKHIRIDLVARYLSDAAQRAVESLTMLFAAVICAIAFYYSLTFVVLEYQFREMAFGPIPAWLCESIMPFAFLVMAIRYALWFWLGISQQIETTT